MCNDMGMVVLDFNLLSDDEKSALQKATPEDFSALPVSLRSAVSGLLRQIQLSGCEKPKVGIEGADCVGNAFTVHKSELVKDGDELIGRMYFVSAVVNESELA